MHNGPEFTLRVFDLWAYDNGVAFDFSSRGQPTDNGLIELSNGTV